MRLTEQKFKQWTEAGDLTVCDIDEYSIACSKNSEKM